LLSITCPAPPQELQVDAVCIRPRIVLVILVTCPAPLHVGQVLYVTPEACIFLLTFTFFSTPLAISSKVSFTRIRRLLPLILALPPPKPPKPPPKPPPKALPKISPN